MTTERYIELLRLPQEELDSVPSQEICEALERAQLDMRESVMDTDIFPVMTARVEFFEDQWNRYPEPAQ